VVTHYSGILTHSDSSTYVCSQIEYRNMKETIFAKWILCQFALPSDLVIYLFIADLD